MRASELLGARVADATGREIGVVQDLRATHAPATAGEERRLRIVGLVVGRDRLVDRVAHGWGFAERRALGPWVLRRLTAGAARRAVYVPVERVTTWRPGVLQLDAERAQLRSLSQELGHE